MDLLAPFRRKAAAALPAPRAATQSAGGGVLIQTSQELDDYLKNGSVSESGAVVTPETAMRVAAVFACVRIISGAVANMPLQLKRRVDDRTREDATDNPLQTVLTKRPNGWMTPSGFKRLMQGNLLMRGNGYALKVRNFRGEVTALLPLHPDRTRAEQRPDMSIVYHYRRKDGFETSFRQEDIFHLIGMTLDGVTGVSVLTYARESIGLAASIRKHGSAFFTNGTNLGAVLRHPHKIGVEGVQALRESLEAYRGDENAQKTLVLEEGMEFEKLGLSAVDAQFVEALKATRTDIAMFFGVPPHMIGDTEKSTSWGSGIDSQTQGFVTYTLEDWLTGWEETVARDLIPDNEPDLFCRFNRSSLVRGDIKTRWDAHVRALQWGVASPNEVRAREDWNPREGGDVFYPPPNTAGTPPADGEGSQNEPPQTP